MRAVYLISTFLAATAFSSAVPQTPAEDAELIPIDDTFGNVAEPRRLYSNPNDIGRPGWIRICSLRI
jgi:hypothetical protein